MYVIENWFALTEWYNNHFVSHPILQSVYLTKKKRKQMSPGSNTPRSSEMHSPKSTGNNLESSTVIAQNTNSMSPSSVSPRTMSPSSDRNGFISDGIGGYQQNFANVVGSYQTNVPPKKSFCIDALLSKNHQSNGDHSPDANRFLSDDDTGNKYSDDQRDYMSSPEDGISRYAFQ